MGSLFAFTSSVKHRLTESLSLSGREDHFKQSTHLPCEKANFFKTRSHHIVRACKNFDITELNLDLIQLQPSHVYKS